MTPISQNPLKKLLISVGIVAGVIIAFILLVITNAHFGMVKEQVTPLPKQAVKKPINVVPADALSYSGEEGKSALTLLEEKTLVEQDKSGIVVSINTKKADASKNEYWALYINAKLASVNPASYITKKNDIIEWKIAHK